MDSEITIPFGKYKYKSVEVLVNDLGYAHSILKADNQNS